MCATGGADRAPEPDLAASFDDGDDHRVGHADPAHEQGDRTEGEQQAGERLVGRVDGGERVRGA